MMAQCITDKGAFAGVPWSSPRRLRRHVGNGPMELSAGNQFKGRVTRIARGGVVAEVTVDIGNGQEIVSVITNGSVEHLNLKEGSEVTAIIKATEVLLA